MPVLTVEDNQILELVRQLPVERRAWLFRQLLQDEWPDWVALAEYAAQRARIVAAERGRDWDTMTDSEREALVDAVVHE